jgi:hypothetical protein
MESYQQLINTLALAMGTAWASGINLYATIAVLGIMGSTGNLILPEQLQVLQSPGVIGAACLMYFVEFFVDKTPGVDSGWDAIHTFIRIPAGAMLAAGAVGDVNPAMVIMAGILGGSVSMASHAVKAGSRVMINTSPEPFTNWVASISEDIAALGGIFVALHYPLLFMGLLALFIILAIWLLPKLWRGIKKIFSIITNLFGGKPSQPPPAPPGPPTPPGSLS